MSNNRQQTRNIVALLVAQAIAAGVGIFAFSRISSTIPVTELGRFGFAVSSTVIFGLLAELGVRYVAIREIALDTSRSRIVFRHSIILRIVLSIGAIALLVAFSEIYPPWQQETRLLFLAGLGAVSQFGAEPVSWVFFGRGRVDTGAIILIIDRILYVAAIHLTATVFHTAEALLLALLAANVMRSLIAWAWLRPTFERTNADQGWDAALFKRMIVGGMSIGAAVVMSVSYMQISTVVAQSVVSAEELGHYAVALGLVNIFLIVPMALTNALFPSLAAAAANSESSVKLYTRMIHLNAMFILPLSLVLFFFAEPLLNVWVGGTYSAAAPLLRVLSIGMAASGMNYLYRIFFFAQNRPTIEATVDLVAFVLMIVFGALAGSQYGSIGIGMVYTVLEVTLLLAKLHLINMLNRKPPGISPQWSKVISRTSSNAPT